MSLSSSPSTRVPTFFFFNDTATTEIYTLSLHDALPISTDPLAAQSPELVWTLPHSHPAQSVRGRDRKSTRLNSSHQIISYAVFCLKKKKCITISAPPSGLSSPSPSSVLCRMQLLSA